MLSFTERVLQDILITILSNTLLYSVKVNLRRRLSEYTLLANQWQSLGTIQSDVGSRQIHGGHESHWEEEELFPQGFDQPPVSVTLTGSVSSARLEMSHLDTWLGVDVEGVD